MSLKSYLSACTAAVVLTSGSAMAGGVIAPVIDVAPVEVAPVSVAGAWQGAYAGGSLGYIFGAEDQVGLAAIQDGTEIGRAEGLGDLDISGATAGVHVGYRWQRGSWVFGPELGVEVGSVDASISNEVGGEAFDLDSDMQNIVTLVMKTGYAVDPQTLVYGTFGIARGDFDYELTTGGETYSEGFTTTGVAAGLGVERMVNERVSVFAEYQYRDLDNETVSFDVAPGATLDSGASTAHSSVKLGANFKF